MRIERISDNQVKFYLTNEDLIERNIKLSEIVFGSEKAQAFFREITEQAADTCGFSADKDGESIPLMVEATQNAEGIVIIVSRVTDMNELQSHIENRLSKNGKPADFGISPAAMTERRFRTKEPELENYKLPADDDNLVIYRFDSINTAAKAARVLSHTFPSYTDSTLYLCEKKYYFLINDTDITGMDKNAFNGIISQYGTKHPSNAISKAYIREHGEAVIKNNAAAILAEL